MNFKKYLSALILTGAIVIFAAPILVSAQAIPTSLPQKTIATDTFVQNILIQVFTPLWQIAVGLAVIMFIVAGILFITSSGEPGKITSARNAVIWGVVGVIVATIAWGMVALVSGWVK